MGGGNWSRDTFSDSASLRATRGIADFGYDADVRSGKAHGIHASLDPKTVAGAASTLAGQNVRESRDIPGEHENSLPVAVFFDVTGSMGEIPRIMQKKLAGLMDVIIDKANITDSQILIGAIGDSTCDQYPFQAGQFESDNRFDETLRAVILEGRGGGQMNESYALAYFFAAHKTATDAWDKRGKKGYLFTIGDEGPWPTVPCDHAQRIFGTSACAETDPTIEELLALALERWEVYHIIPTTGGSHGTDPRVQARWRELLGERVVLIDDITLICEVIAGVIHGLESAYDATKVLDDIGLTGAARGSVQNALVPVLSGRVPTSVGVGAAPGGGSANIGSSDVVTL